MKNYKNIKRIFEQDAAITSADTAELEAGMQPEMDMSFPAEPAPALPAPGQTSAPADPMTMTVGDFINKCKEIDPLVCMGLESFIEKNRSAFGGEQMPMPPADQDITFSTAVTPAPTQMAPPAPAQQFSLDQPTDIKFPA